LRRASDDIVEDRQGQRGHAAHGQHGALHGVIDLGIARLQPQPPDFCDDRLTFGFVLGGFEAGEQGIELLCAGSIARRRGRRGRRLGPQRGGT
jgi:hypothetical protein